MKFLRIILLSALMVTGAHAQEIKFSKKKIQVGSVKLEVEIAETSAQHERGLMFRKSLGANDGMLFIFHNEDVRYFWMKNTFVPLSIGYFSKSGKLVDIQEMAAVKSEMEMNPPTYPSKLPAQYALEMNPGWFEKNKIKLGAKLIVK